MGNGVNQNLNGTNPIAAIIESENFLNLDHNTQNKIIEAVYSDKEKDGGLMGKFLGNRPSNMSLNICLILCVLLMVFLLIDCVHSYQIGKSINMELVSVVIPVISLSLGYVFGKSC